MAELVYARALGARSARIRGSSPLGSTIIFCSKKSNMLQVVSYYIKFAGSMAFALFFLVLFFYCALRFIFSILDLVFFKKSFSCQTKNLLKGAFFIFLWFFALLSFFIFVIVEIAIYTKLQKIFFFDNAFMQIDKSLFGIYIPFWFQNANNPLKIFFDETAPIFIGCYTMLALFLSALFCILLAKNADYFYKMLIAFSLTILISLPL